MQQHPLSAAFPSMPESEIAALAIDIETHGQREPGVTLDGLILDGWHRYLACHRLGVQFKAKAFDGADPVAFVISHNLHRRHLTASQRAAAVVAAHNWRPSGLNRSPAPGADRTTAEMAKEAEVSPRTIEQAKAAETAGLGDKVRDGEVSAKRASEVAKLPPAKRARALKEPKPAKEKKPTADAAEVTKLRARIEDLTEQRDNLSETCREQEDRLTVFAATQLDEQQKLIATLQKRTVRLEAEVDRVKQERDRLQDKCNALIRQVKSLQKNAR